MSSKLDFPEHMPPKPKDNFPVCVFLDSFLLEHNTAPFKFEQSNPSDVEYIKKLCEFLKTLVGKYPSLVIFGWRPFGFSRESPELNELMELLATIPTIHELPKNQPIVIIIGLPDFSQRFAPIESKVIHHSLDGTLSDLDRFDKIVKDIYNPEKRVEMHLQPEKQKDDADDMPDGPAILPRDTLFHCRFVSGYLPLKPEPNASPANLPEPEIPCLPPLKRLYTEVLPLDAEIPSLPPLKRLCTEVLPLDAEIPCLRCAAKKALVLDVPDSLPPQIERECPDCHDLGFLKVFPPQP